MKPFALPKETSPEAETPGAGEFCFVSLLMSVAGQHRLLRHQMLDIDPEPFRNPASISRVPPSESAQSVFPSGGRDSPSTRHCSRNLSGRTLRLADPNHRNGS